MKSSTGLDENIAALLCYPFGFITGIVFFILEKQSRLVKFHAVQSILLSIVFLVVDRVVRILPLFGHSAASLLNLLELLVVVFIMIKSYKFEWYKLPVIGDIAERQANS